MMTMKKKYLMPLYDHYGHFLNFIYELWTVIYEPLVCLLKQLMSQPDIHIHLHGRGNPRLHYTCTLTRFIEEQ